MKHTKTHTRHGPLRRDSALAVGGLILAGAVAACSGGTSASTSTGTHPDPQPTDHPSVSSSIRSGTVLRHPLVWQDAAAADSGSPIDHVDFLVDGKLRWTEHNEPYQFNDGRLFAPWPLGAGPHTLSLRATTFGGASTETSASVVVKVDRNRAALPTATYYRTVSHAAIGRVSGYRDAVHGAFGVIPPTGRWGLRVREDGVIVIGYVPDHEYDWTYLPFQTRDDRLTLFGPAVWLQPHPDRPSLFCDPEPPATYRWTTRGHDLTIGAVARTCADRDEVLLGTWRRR